MRFLESIALLSLLLPSHLVQAVPSKSAEYPKCFALALSDALDMGPYQAGVLSNLANLLPPE